jgi:epoxyqueuosine reductase
VSDSAKAAFQSAAKTAGFELAGVAEALPHPDYLIYNEWIKDGCAGPMRYLAGHRAEVRADPRHLMPSARSLLCVGKLYRTEEIHPHTVSRYAWGPSDYHDVLRARLACVLILMHEQLGPFESRIVVDTAPLLERSYARAAGLGWIGRNTCLINQPEGSWFFLGTALVSLEIEPDRPAAFRCGTCRRCIDACPTQALVPSRDGSRWRLDARRCISTWTIEQKGVLDEQDRAASGSHLFGCDICQEVCPWNRRAPVSPDPAFQPVNANPDLVELVDLPPEIFRARFGETPFGYAGRRKLRRNAVTVMGNSGDPRHVPTLKRLAGDDDAAVRAHAGWALARLGEAPK